MSERLLGIDIGTTGVRAAIFDASGKLRADASVKSSYMAPSPGFAEARADGFWEATKTVLTDLARQTSFDDVHAIAVVGQAPTAVLVDDNGQPLSPAILWLDTRASAEASELGEQAYYLGPKLLWLSRHADPALAKARWVLQSHAFVAQCLTDEVATDPSTAALCRPLFDFAKRAWSGAACARVGVRLDQLPPIKRASDVLGAVTDRAAKETGLRAGTPVLVGGGDFAAATLGAGVIDEGEACLMLGTAGNILVPRSTPGMDVRLINAHHVGVDRWLSLGGVLSGGAQEWLRHALVRGMGEDTAVRGALPAFELLDAEAEQVHVGSDGLLFLPYLQGERSPIWDTDARGAYVGLGLHHGRGHLWRALLEGIALGFADCQSVLAEDGVVLRDVVAANGGGKSALFRQILCDALGVPLAYAPGAPGTVAGAALIAALGTGLLTDASEARAWRGSVVRHDPNREATERYHELLHLRREAYRGLKPVFSGLAPLRAARSE